MEVGVVRIGGKLTESDVRVSDAGAAGDICVEQFIKEHAVGETTGMGELRIMFRGAFRKTWIGIHQVNSVGVEGSGMGGEVGIGEFSSAVGGEETIDVAFTEDNYGVVVLVNIMAVEIGEET